MLESGGLGLETEPQDLNIGQQQGFIDDLTGSRPRTFGGATAIWSGYCASLDSDDFEPQPWAGSKGWPIPYSDLAGLLRARLSIPGHRAESARPGALHR